MRIGSRHRWWITPVVLAGLGLGLTRSDAATTQPVHNATALAQPAATFDIGLMGDMPYDATQAAKMPALWASIAATPLSFVIHDGDFKSGSSRCDDSTFDAALADFQTVPHPMIYVPGDNDWTDCHRANNGGYDPLERLAKLRSMFFPGSESLGQRKLTLTRQSDDPRYEKYRENVRWSMGEVTFVGLNVQGSNNNLARNPENDAEWAERDPIVIEWLRQAFSSAKQNNHKGIMVVIQANIFENDAPKDGPDGYKNFVNALEEETRTFPGQVMLVHGDSHYFRVDKPLPLDLTKPRLENFTRLETFGSPNVHWVKVTVNADEPQVFTVRQMMVK